MMGREKGHLVVRCKRRECWGLDESRELGTKIKSLFGLWRESF